MYLLFAFLVVPVLEIAVFIQVGGLIGLWPTVALVLFTAVAGTTLLRVQGLAVLQRARASLERNELPMQEVFDGLCLVLAGALLLTPGFVTDTLGLLLFLPPVRAALRRWMFSYLRRRGEMKVFVGGQEVDMDTAGRPAGAGRGPGVIDADFREIDDDRPGDGKIGDGKIGAGETGDDDASRDPPPPDSRWAPPNSRFRR